MTKQEILEHFKDINHAYNESTRLDDLSHMLDELMQSNSDGDCISREEVCDYIAEFVNHEYATDREHEMVKHIIGGIQHLPGIQPKPKYVAVGNVNFDKDELQKIIDEAIPTIMPEIEYKRARWINNACSNCGIYNASAYKNWCPNCGCQMTEEIE